MAVARARWVGLAVLGAVLGATHAGASAVTPVEKVIDLMKKLQTKLEAEGKEEAAQYDKYACFCKDEADTKQYNIEKSTKKIGVLTSEINELGAEIADLDEAIKQLVTDIKGLEGEVDTLEKARAKEHANYTKHEADISGAIAALQGAIDSLKESKEQMADDAKVDLMQVRKSARTVMTAILSANMDVSQKHMAAIESLAGQSPPAYEYRSNDIIGTLEGLLNTKFLPQKKELDKLEFEAQATFEKRTLGLKNEIKFAEKDKAEKEEVVGKKTEEKEAAAEDKNQENTDMSADQAFLETLTADCEEKATLWDQRSKSRAGEMTALAEALEALETGVAGNYDANEKLVGFVQKEKPKPQPTASKKQAAPAPASFLQLRKLRGSAKREASRSAGEQLSTMVAAAALKLNSQVLSVAAVRLSACEDHFVKVRALINDLIAKLDADAKAEASQKGFCDTEMGKAVSARDAAQAEIESIAASTTEAESEKATLLKEIAELSEAIASDQKALSEAEELRAAESKENQEKVDDATEGKTAVELAIRVLQEYYSKGSFIQAGPLDTVKDREGNTMSDKAPEIFDSKYGGDQAANKGIMGMLQVILSDFDRTISTVTTEEGEAVTEFNAFKGTTTGSITSKSGSKDTKEGRVRELDDDLVDFESRMQDEKLLLDSALKTLTQLKEKCVQGEETYAERVAKRKKEIEALKEALDTLENWQS